MSDWETFEGDYAEAFQRAYHSWKEESQTLDLLSGAYLEICDTPLVDKFADSLMKAYNFNRIKRDMV